MNDLKSMSIRDKRGLDKKGRRIYEKQYGQIPSGHHIHHKNGDHSDNSLDNLVLMKASDHLSWHNLKRLSEDVKKIGTHDQSGLGIQTLIMVLL